jgi:hypothetical protein
MQLVLLAEMNEDVGSKSDSEIRTVLRSQIAQLEAAKLWKCSQEPLWYVGLGSSSIHSARDLRPANVRSS